MHEDLQALASAVAARCAGASVAPLDPADECLKNALAAAGAVLAPLTDATWAVLRECRGDWSQLVDEAHARGFTSDDGGALPPACAAALLMRGDGTPIALRHVVALRFRLGRAERELARALADESDARDEAAAGGAGLAAAVRDVERDVRGLQDALGALQRSIAIATARPLWRLKLKWHPGKPR